MDVVPGLRVVRGPDWKWGDQDGGEGQVGTVAEIKTMEEPVDGKILARAVVVQWDGGNRSNYRCGLEGKYDLRVFDNATAGVKHDSIVCDSCRQNGITGMRWKCSKCYDYDLCTACYNAGKHSLEHEFSRYDVLDNFSCRVAPRKTAKRVTAKGLFPDAEVVRGQDWLWADQDGGLGKSGLLLEVRGWENVTYRSVVEVEWKEIHKKNVYRVGHKGKVDLKCKESASGGYYYPEHLPVLGAPNAPPPPSKPHDFQAGDRVKVQLELEIFKMMQEGHGGWNDQMAEGLTEVGTVQTVLDSGDVRIRFPSNRTWTINPDAVAKIPQHSGGDVIRVLDDIATVHDLQEGHGGWVDDMALSLGQVGRVIKVFPTGDVRVAVNGRTWTYNPQCLQPAPGENPPEIPPPDTDLETEDLGLHLKLLSLLENPAVIVAAAASGDVDTLRDFLRKHPKEVNAKAAGKAAIHCAAVAGNIAVLKVLLEFKADVEIKDEDGDRPLHLCAYSDEDEAAKLLIDVGANVNSKNLKGATPLVIAAVKGHYSVLRLLVNHPSIQLHEQDSDGDTALHCAVLAQKNESVAILLESGTDPTLLNFRLFTPIHEAARIGFLPAVEHFIRKFPQYINLKKDDGYTPLHLASLNDHLDVATIFADLDICEIDAVTHAGMTALHIAVHQGHSRIVERLVGFGANLNAQDSDGDTPLHLTLLREAVDTLSADTPQLKKVRQCLQSKDDTIPLASATVAGFLVQEGADMYLQNRKGRTPLQLCSTDVAAILTTFAERKVPFPFHGSLRTNAKTGVQAIGPQDTGHRKSTPMEAGTVSGKAETTVSSMQGASAAGGYDVCFLCEMPVDVKFEPCGHALMCNQCAERAKKCPTCKTPIKTISKLKEMCAMCKEEQGSVTVRPCGHKFCAACARRMKTCFECRADIESKEGLAPESHAAPQAGTSVDTSPCPICLTEPRNTAFLCGHQLCWECAQRVDHCPVCRKFVTHRIRLFQ